MNLRACATTASVVTVAVVCAGLVATAPATPSPPALPRVESSTQPHPVPPPAAARTSKAKLTVSSVPKVTANSKFELSGRVVTLGKGRTVRLYVKRGSTWRSAAKKKTTRSGRFSFTIKAPAAAGAPKFKVVAPRSGKLAKRSATRAVKVVPRASVKPPETTSSRLSVNWTATKVTAGASATFTASGQLTGHDVAGRTVVVERLFRDGWKREASQKTTSAGTFTARVPANFYSSLETRIRVEKSAADTAHVSSKVKLVAEPDFEPAGRAKSWNYISKQARYRWNPCTGPITYRTNVTQGPSGAAASVEAAFGQVSLATGLKFKHLGSTTAHAFGKNGTPKRPKDADLVVSFSKPSQVDPDMSGTIAGWGGPEMGYEGFDARGPVIEVTQAAVLLNASMDWKPKTLAGVSAHEIAHAIGLGHVRDEAQLMNESWGKQATTNFGAGDLTGLSLLGAAEGCIQEERFAAPKPSKLDAAHGLHLTAHFNH